MTNFFESDDYTRGFGYPLTLFRFKKAKLNSLLAR